MQRLEVSGAIRPLYGSLGFKGLIKDDSNYMFRPIAAIIRVFIRKYGGSALWGWYGYVTMVRSQQMLR